MDVRNIADLPGNHVMQMTRRVVLHVMTGSTTGYNNEMRRQPTITSRTSSYEGSLSSRSSKPHLKSYKNLGTSTEKRKGEKSPTRNNEHQRRKVNAKDVTFRCKDHMPYYNQELNNNKMALSRGAVSLARCPCRPGPTGRGPGYSR